MTMILNDKKNNEIKFPCDWEFRAFCQCGKSAAALETIGKLAAAVDKNARTGYGELSKSGTYRTIRVTAQVRSKDEANALALKISEVDGIKFML